MSKMDNLLSILWMLHSDHKITAKQIAEELEINIRTVYRYMDKLSASGVPIVSDTGHHGGYTLLKHFMEAPLFFDHEEQTSLIHAVVFAKKAGYYGGESLDKAITKLHHHTNQKQAAQVEKHINHLEVISGQHSFSMQPSMETYLHTIAIAITEGITIRINYRKNNEEQSTSRLLDPYKMMYWNENWYVIGFCHLRNDIRSFRVQRIEHVEWSQQHFTAPKHFSARDFFFKNLLPTIENKKEIVSFRIQGNKSTVDEICQHWFLGHYVHEHTENNAAFLFEKNMLHTHVPYFMLPFGTSIQVIEPTSFKTRMVEVLSELIQFYQT
ncbi:helix-turn-helix transcriptional regulator [Longirhabdus pacifica]|uniref:helix-turn-helix transcriptional regulator n=1 Tax=Longirhabdus pacifica TaxID=2305227 RepID=UPI0010090792|nr:YafY family protein [Longirhabdus pacifica]